jgi:tritrans,polycis-undecaprenyl-diphosphate synthase [geranylgeranyl-diphosphate specific]
VNPLISAFQRFVIFFAANRLAIRLYEWILKNQIKGGEIPGHIAIILDGNRRWAASRRMLTFNGHLEGAKKAEEFFEWCRELNGIKTITLYVFSTENFRRPPEEVQHLMNLIKGYLEKLATDKRIHANKVRVKVIGKVDLLPPEIREAVRRVEEATKDYNERYLNLAIAYGGRAEILDALRQIAEEVKSGRLSPDQLNEEVFEKFLYTSFLPNPHPDLIIRTSGEERLSNFLLWQGAYSELCFLDVYWPGFEKKDLYRAIRIYQQRKRRFGA